MSGADPSSAKHQDNGVSLVQCLYFIASAEIQIKCKVKNVPNCFAKLDGRETPALVYREVPVY